MGLDTLHCASWCDPAMIILWQTIHPDSLLPQGFLDNTHENCAYSNECEKTVAERPRRCILIRDEDPRLKHEPFVSALYLHKNNQPKYHSMLQRALEHAKGFQGGPRFV